jgi:hypothetical protein
MMTPLMNSARSKKHFTVATPALTAALPSVHRRVALKSAGRLLFDIRPRRIGNRGKLAVKVIHIGFLL